MWRAYYLLAILSVLQAQYQHKVSETDYLPASGFGEPYRFVSPLARISGEPEVLPRQPLDWLGIAPAMLANISGPILAGTINTAGYAHQPTGGQGDRFPRPVPMIEGEPNLSMGFAQPGRIRGRKVVLAGAAAYTDISGRAYEPFQDLLTSPDALTYSGDRNERVPGFNRQQRHIVEGLLTVTMELNPTLSIALHGGLSRSTIDRDFRRGSGDPYSEEIRSSLGEEDSHQQLGNGEWGLSLQYRHSEDRVSFASVTRIQATGNFSANYLMAQYWLWPTEPWEAIDYTNASITGNVDGSSWIFQLGRQIDLGSSGELTVRYELALYRSDAQASNYWSWRFDDVLDWNYSSQALPGRNRQALMLGYLNDSHKRLTFRAGLVYRHLTAFTRSITYHHNGLLKPRWTEARLHRWEASLPVGMVLKPEGLLGRWVNLYVGLEGRYAVPGNSAGIQSWYPWYEEAKPAGKVRGRLVHHWGLSLFPESKLRGYIYARDIFWQLARNESLPMVQIGFDVSL